MDNQGIGLNKQIQFGCKKEFKDSGEVLLNFYDARQFPFL